MNEQLIVIERDGPVGILTINRPAALNALSFSVMNALEDSLNAFETDDAIRVILLFGGARAFAAGADVAEMAAIQNSAEARDILSDHLARWDALGRCRKPTIAAVAGFTLGGGLELAMACDIIVAAESAVFAMPEVLVGVMPGAGGVHRLYSAVGRALAVDMLLSGRRLSASQAQAAGLVSRVFPTDALEPNAKALARDIAKAPARAVRAVKSAIQIDDRSEDIMARQREFFYELFDTHDQKEGMRSFLEKRSPSFIDR